jgi:purine-binding chemotaxis protein CheW
MLTELVRGTSQTQRELVLITIAGQTYALGISALREIRSWTPATVLPGSPDYIRGVVNLRGMVLPIVDLALRLGFARTEADSRCAVVVVQIAGRNLGLLVEGVSEIISVDASAIQPPPGIDGMSSSVVCGLLPMADRMIGILETERLINVDQDLPDVG